MHGQIHCFNPERKEQNEGTKGIEERKNVRDEDTKKKIMISQRISTSCDISSLFNKFTAAVRRRAGNEC
jgi:hypothetical protein